MPTDREFRDLVNATPDIVTAHLGDLHGLYAAVGLAPAKNLTLRAVSDHFHRILRRHCPLDLLSVWHGFKALQRQLILRHVIEGIPLEPYLSVARAAFDNVRSARGADEEPEQENWPLVVHCAVQLVALQPAVYRLDEATTRQFFNREFALAAAAARLRAAGVGLELDDAGFRFPEAAQEHAIRLLDEQLARFGGVRAIEYMYRMLVSVYDERMQRYQIGRSVDALGANAHPQVAFGLLLQLAVKHLADASTVSDERLWDEIIAFSTDVGAVYDVQAYSLWELENRDRISFIPYLQELALYDTLFRIRQLRPRDLPVMLGSLFDWVTAEHEDRIGFRISTAICFSQAFFDPRQDHPRPHRITLGDVRSALPDVSEIECRALFSALCHAPRSVNRDYRSPTSLPGPDFGFRPLVGLDPDSAFLVDPSICAPAMYEAIVTALRAIEPGTQDRIGTAGERLVTRRLQECGVTLHCGKYREHGTDGECDGVVETTRCILFLEKKAKALTRGAQAARDAQILIDLSKSLLDALLQANGHELLIRRHGSLHLEHDGGATEVSFQGRSVEKVAITLLDFGSFQDRTVIFQLFELCARGTFGAVDTAFGKEIAKLNEKARQLVEQWKELLGLVPAYGGRVFFNSWFLSLPQILVLLDNVRSNDDFVRELQRTRNMTAHTLDWYREHALALGFREATR